jgi:aminobenzoyl-glutamate utilization protein B
MDYMVNMMREHIPQETRIHYVITNGGKAPNVVPDFAEAYYYVRHPKKEEMVRIFDWVTKAAEGAALGRQTKMDYEVIGGTHDLLPNRLLAEAMQQDLQRVDGVSYSPAEVEFAQKIQASFTYGVPAIDCFTKPELVAAAKAELGKDKGNYHYQALLGDRKPALNYRD